MYLSEINQECRTPMQNSYELCNKELSKKSDLHNGGGTGCGSSKMGVRKSVRQQSTWEANKFK